MPFDEGFRFDDHKRASPVEQPAETDHEETERRGRTLGSDLAFLKEGELLSEEKILRNGK
jgi:hypothetical protein